MLALLEFGTGIAGLGKPVIRIDHVFRGAKTTPPSADPSFLGNLGGGELVSC